MLAAIFSSKYYLCNILIITLVRFNVKGFVD